MNQLHRAGPHVVLALGGAALCAVGGLVASTQCANTGRRRKSSGGRRNSSGSSRRSSRRSSGTSRAAQKAAEEHARKQAATPWGKAMAQLTQGALFQGPVCRYLEE